VRVVDGCGGGGGVAKKGTQKVGGSGRLYRKAASTFAISAALGEGEKGNHGRSARTRGEAQANPTNPGKAAGCRLQSPKGAFVTYELALVFRCLAVASFL